MRTTALLVHLLHWTATRWHLRIKLQRQQTGVERLNVIFRTFKSCNIANIGNTRNAKVLRFFFAHS